MARLDFEAIKRAYPKVVEIDETGPKILDATGQPVNVEQSNIDAARVALNAEYAALEYSRQRAEEYPSIVDQLDDIYHNGIDAWKATIKATKDKYPKT